MARGTSPARLSGSVLPAACVAVVAVLAAIAGTARASTAGDADTEPYPPSALAQRDRIRAKAPEASATSTRVLLFPHSHDDVGWTETIAQYYSDKVHDIYSTITAQLSADKARRFSSVEMAFLWRWWVNATTTDAERAAFRTLVHAGQVELLLGGWCMQDELVSAWDADIDQMTEGHRFITATFGGEASAPYRPRTSWQIDPFGGSATTPVHFSRMGFTGHVADRINYVQKAALMEAGTLDIQWAPANSGAPNGGMTTHVMDSYGYCAPDNPRNIYYWDDYGYWNATGEPPLNASSARTFASGMLAHVYERRVWSERPDVLFFPWGCDFEFHNASQMFGSMDLAVAAMNANASSSGVTVEYATPSQYFAAIRGATTASGNIAGGTSGAAAPARPHYDGDFVPYTPDNTSWWTGFYTSRPALKGIARRAYATLRAVEVAYAVGGGRPDVELPPTQVEPTSGAPTPPVAYGYDATRGSQYAGVQLLRQASGEVQHHDAVTGTAMPPVVQMYRDHLAAGTAAAAPVIEACVASILGHASGSSNEAAAGASTEATAGVGCTGSGPPLTTQPTALSVLASASPGSSTVVPVVLFNSLGWRRTEVANVSVPRSDLVVTDSTGALVRSQAIATSLAPRSANDGGDGDATQYTLYFEAANLPPLGAATFFVQVASPAQRLRLQRESRRSYRVSASPTRNGDCAGVDPGATADDDAPVVLRNGALAVSVGAQGLQSIQNVASGAAVTLSGPEWWSYPSAFNTSLGATSDAYQMNIRAPPQPLAAAHGELAPCPPSRQHGSKPTTVRDPLVAGFSIVADHGPLVSQAVVSSGVAGTYSTYRLFSVGNSSSSSSGATLEHGLLGVDPAAQRLQARLEVTHHVGTPAKNSEVAVRYAAQGWANAGEFTTDANGWLRRPRSRNATVSSDPLLSIVANVYPTVASASIASEPAAAATASARGTGTAGNGLLRLAMVTDRSHGVTSPVDGALDVMLHRRLFQENATGFYAPPLISLNDTDVLDVRSALLFDGDAAVTASVPQQSLLLAHPPVALYPAAPAASAKSWVSTYGTTARPIPGPLGLAGLPSDVHLLSLQVRPFAECGGASVLMRLANLLGPDEASARDVTVDGDAVAAAAVFRRGTSVTGATETMLSTLYRAAGDAAGTPALGNVTLAPLDTRTWVLNVDA